MNSILKYFSPADFACGTMEKQEKDSASFNWNSFDLESLETYGNQFQNLLFAPPKNINHCEVINQFYGTLLYQPDELKRMAVSWLQLAEPIKEYCSIYHVDPRDYCYSVYDFLAASFDLIDGRTEKERERYSIHPHDEKKLPQFAVFYVKLKQLILKLIHSLSHAKRRLRISSKSDIISILRTLRTSGLRDRQESLVEFHANHSTLFLCNVIHGANHEKRRTESFTFSICTA